MPPASTGSTSTARCPRGSECRYGVGAAIRWFEAKPCYIYHAYLRLNAHIYRYRFDLRTGQTTEGPLDDDDIEFPSVDTRVVSRPHRYSCSMHLATKETLLFDGLVRFDSRTGDKQQHLFGPGRWAGEAPFAPRDGSTGETDGYLVSFVTDEREQRSEVAIFDAADVAAGPVGRVLLPRRVPIGFHACWVPAERT